MKQVQRSNFHCEEIINEADVLSVNFITAKLMTLIVIYVLCDSQCECLWLSKNKLCMQLNLSNVSLKYFLRTSKTKVVCGEKDRNKN